MRMKRHTTNNHKSECVRRKREIALRKRDRAKEINQAAEGDLIFSIYQLYEDSTSTRIYWCSFRWPAFRYA